MPSRKITDDSLFRASFRSASSLIALQLFSRVFTFALNQAMLRMATPRAYGTAAIQFELMLNTILFLSREGVRNALLRVRKKGISTMNLSILPILFGFPLALGTSFLYARVAGSEVRIQDYFTISINIYALAALLELMSEPLHNLAMSELRTGVRVTAEGLGITNKTLLTFIILLYDTRNHYQGTLGLLAFAGGQLAYSASVLITYMAYYGIWDMWPKRPPQTGNKHPNYFDAEILRLSLTMTSQSVIKHFLTEGDKLILSWFSPLQDQGGYAIAVNYGSLVARVIFQPVEEACRVFFSKTLGSSGPVTDAHNRKGFQQAGTILISLLSVQVALSIVLVVFGTAYIPVILHILLPHQYLLTSAPKVLSAWVWYIPVLALNGGLEAFSSSVATPRDLTNQSRWMAGFSMAYILAAITFFRFHMGDTSLVYANILNLSARIVYSAHFINSFFTRHSARHLITWSSVIPKWPLLLSATISTWIIRVARGNLGIGAMYERGEISLVNAAVLSYIALGASMALVSLTVWWISSGRYLTIPRQLKPE